MVNKVHNFRFFYTEQVQCIRRKRVLFIIDRLSLTQSSDPINVVLLGYRRQSSGQLSPHLELLDYVPLLLLDKIIILHKTSEYDLCLFEFLDTCLIK
jgi:hypothetical protein